MPVRVKLYNLLAERSLSGRDEYEVPFEDGLRPVDLIHREGFFGEEEQAIVVLVNDEQSTREAALSDGDRVELMINMVGGGSASGRPMSTARDNALDLAHSIARRLSELDRVIAVALGGSFAERGAPDSLSDIDLYAYVTQLPSLDERRSLAAGGRDLEVPHDIWETSDAWVDASTGIVVDVMYRSPDWLEGELDRVLVRHKASVGCSTCTWHNVRHARALYDGDGWFARQQERARQPYPPELQIAVIGKNHPALRDSVFSFVQQIEKAAGRDDRVSIQHRTAGLLASYFDVLFAANALTHPGEKRLVDYAEEHCARLPASFRKDMEALLAAPLERPEAVRAGCHRLVDALDEALRLAGLFPRNAKPMIN